MGDEQKIETFDQSITHKVESMLIDFFQSERKKNKFISLLKRNNAIIAGGSILSSIHDQSVNDLDIYVNKRNFSRLYNSLDIMLKLKYDPKVHFACSYKQSFFRRNNIIARVSIHDLPIDIIIITDHILIEDVVTNFDLSFCQVWYNGIDVKSDYKDHVLSKKGILRDDYKECLFKFYNEFIVKRIKKYRIKGYEIEVGERPSYINNFIDKIKDVTEEEWFFSKLYKQLIILSSSKRPYDEGFDLIISPVRYDLESFTLVLDPYIGNGKIFNSLEFAIETLFKFSFMDTRSYDYLSQKYIDYIDTVINKQKLKKILKKIDETGIEIFSYHLQLYKTINKKFKDIFDNNNKKRLLENYGVRRGSINEIEYDEKSKKTCTDLVIGGNYDIEKYLKGEECIGKTLDDDEEDEDLKIDAVSPEEAKDRLVFFLKVGQDEFKPFCYSRDYLVSDLNTHIFAECNRRPRGGFDADDFKNPIIKLDFEIPVFVYVSSLLTALYQTNKQVFLITPSDYEYKLTYSLDVYNCGSYVSADHCQAGSNKKIYNIHACKGNGTNNCYPIYNDRDVLPPLDENEQEYKSENNMEYIKYMHYKLCRERGQQYRSESDDDQSGSDDDRSGSDDDLPNLSDDDQSGSDDDRSGSDDE
jgi:hypothetical protein